jgi:hypothetical protein
MASDALAHRGPLPEQQRRKQSRDRRFALEKVPAPEIPATQILSHFLDESRETELGRYGVNKWVLWVATM